MRIGLLPFAALALAVWAGASPQEKQPSNKAAATQDAKPVAAVTKEYVGSETCAGLIQTPNRRSRLRVFGRRP